MDTEKIALWLWNWLSYGVDIHPKSVAAMPDSDVLDRLKKLVKHTDFNEVDIKEIVQK